MCSGGACACSSLVASRMIAVFGARGLNDRVYLIALAGVAHFHRVHRVHRVRDSPQQGACLHCGGVCPYVCADKLVCEAEELGL
jgi:hypothetical protein